MPCTPNRPELTEVGSRIRYQHHGPVFKTSGSCTPVQYKVGVIERTSDLYVWLEDETKVPKRCIMGLALEPAEHRYLVHVWTGNEPGTGNHITVGVVAKTGEKAKQSAVQACRRMLRGLEWTAGGTRRIE